MNTKKCKVFNCENSYHAKGYCRRHYHQIFYYGEIKNRTWFDKNNFIIENDITKIILFNQKQIKVGEALIDTKYLKKCQNIKWRLHKGYVVGFPKIKLSEFIFGKKKYDSTIIDHIDSNPLNNKRNNLQEITNQQNQIKKKMQGNNTSKYRGVTYNKNAKKWQTTIVKNYKHYYLGLFSDKKEAALAYNKKAKELFGRFAILNKVN